MGLVWHYKINSQPPNSCFRGWDIHFLNISFDDGRKKKLKQKGSEDCSRLVLPFGIWSLRVTFGDNVDEMAGENKWHSFSFDVELAFKVPQEVAKVYVKQLWK